MQTSKWYHGMRDDFGQAHLFVEERDKDMRVSHVQELQCVDKAGIDWSYIGFSPRRCASMIVANLLIDTDELPSVKYKRAEPAMLRITSNVLAGLPRGEWKRPASDFVKYLSWRDRWLYRWNRFTRTLKRKDINGL